MVENRATRSNSCFSLIGDKLFGTVYFLAFKRGIEDGRIDGDKISFTVRFQAASQGMTSEHRYGHCVRQPDSFQNAG